MSFTLYTIAERPGLEDDTYRVTGLAWPRFMLEDPVADRYWSRLYSMFADFQFVLCDDHQQVIAVGNSIPLYWGGTAENLPQGWDAELEQGFLDHEAGRTPNTLGALSITIDPSRQGQGHSRTMLQAMRSIAARHGLRALIAPVRPTLKARYPLTSIERYAAWTQEDGAPFDPWLRTHWRLGARVLCVAPRSMVIEASVGEWEGWTAMRFPESGSYVVPGALQPIQIDRETDRGSYEDPNVWMHHAIDPGWSKGQK